MSDEDDFIFSGRLVRFLRAHPSGVVRGSIIWCLSISLLTTRPWRWSWLEWVLIGPLYAMVAVMFFLLWRISRLVDHQQRTSREHEQ